MLPSGVSIEQLNQIALDAGAEILMVYQSDFDFLTKGDGSPLTIADQRAHTLIEASLRKLTPTIPVLSEESIHEIGDARLSWNQYWLVDPLDGTKEFIKRNGEFTVNIALIDNGQPVVGIVYAPVLETLYFAVKNEGAYKQINGHLVSNISARKLDLAKVKIVASRSHMSDEVKQFTASIKTKANTTELISMGSSLKLCLVAEGSADYYPRLGLTSEWDTAAAQCIVEAAGGKVIDCDGADLTYTKQDILNPWFLVMADPTTECDCGGFF